MRILTLALVSALVLNTACKKVDDAPASAVAEASALPEVTVPELSEATMKDVTRELSLDSYEAVRRGRQAKKRRSII